MTRRSTSARTNGSPTCSLARRWQVTSEFGAQLDAYDWQRERDGRWGVYDIGVDGVSLISNYRSQFTSVLKRMSFAQMLDRLRNREASVGSRQEAGQ